ncbi:MAG: class C sortase [Ruminococcaceae bacterium]|nr:class C sortase [Oscillospiraceae bacterium]
MKKKRKWSTFILLAIFFIGLSVMLYPAISNYWNQRTQSKAIVDYEKMLESIPKEDYTRIFESADEYNSQLNSLSFPLLEYKRVSGYSELLDISSTGMMGYITIDAIGLELPVYHTTEDNVLSVAVGHLQGSSLPVGGEGTHAVLSAHRGLPTATLFTNLDHLELGDVFVITVLDRVLTYQVDQIKTVDPDDTSDLLVEAGMDYCTLLTCTPYGINTHRLLVRGVRTETVQQRTVYVTSDAHQIDSLIVTPIVALPILFTLMMIVLLKPVKKDDLGDDL